MNNLGDFVWERTGQDQVSRRIFNVVYIYLTVFGLGVSAWAAMQTLDWTIIGPVGPEYVGPNIWLLVIGVLAVSFFGIWLAVKSDNPIVSFIGYMLVCFPMGFFMGPTIAMYTEASVMKIMVVTIMITAVLGLMGAIYPKSLESWSGWLFGGLIVLIIGQFAIPIAASMGLPIDYEAALTIWDWAGVLLFSGYIIYDVNKAQRVPATVDNAVDCALALYLDIINLFLRLLRLYGEAKK